MPKEALFWKKLNGEVQCQLCPHYCSLKPEELGKCRARQNRGGKLISLSYGRPCSINLDPIEKKPFYHFLPGHKTLSIATAGCNLSCSHCQNWEISQCSPQKMGQELEPGEVVKKALEKNAKIISYTYTEPAIFYEYMLDIAKLARKEGIKNTMVSNGFINQKPLKKLLPYMDAANIDLKALSDKHYKEICGARLEPVLETIKTLKEKGVWIELTNLLIPGLNDSKENIERLVEWIKDNIGAEVPVHFSAFYPTYKMKDKRPTPIEKVERAGEIAKSNGLKFVYTGNLEENNTACPNCGKVLIRRGGRVEKEFRRRRLTCSKCGEKIEGVWE